MEKEKAFLAVLLVIAVLVFSGCTEPAPEPAPGPETGDWQPEPTPPAGGEDDGGGNEDNGDEEPPPEPGPQEVKTAEEESVVSFSREVQDSITADGGESSESWDYMADLEIRGKLRTIPLEEGEEDYYFGRYELVDATVTWNVSNEYVYTYVSSSDKVTITTYITSADSSDSLENLTTFTDFGMPYEMQDSGYFVLEIMPDGSYDVLARFFVPANDIVNGEMGQTSLEYKIPVEGTYSLAGKEITGSGIYRNLGGIPGGIGSTGVVEVDHGSKGTSPLEEKGEWNFAWSFNLP